jgi:hypothetical protein
MPVEGPIRQPEGGSVKGPLQMLCDLFKVFT